ncbi:SagB family peptide dehydrogenase [Saccharopolyspora cebuensis]|uniref:SagB family peptide dehydrogenase n=1 Tax=Saccharopolyspora cebuensis TaxID=418759 RepID=UPI0031EB20B7
MGNWDLDIGEHYLRRTVHEAEELFAEVLAEDPIGADPLPFKVYRGVPRYRLPEGLPLEIGDARRCFADVPTSGDMPGGEPDGVLAALLYYAYGFSRWDEGPGAVWPYHRVVPSARCYFPTELSLWIPRTGGIPAGLYHYDPLHHSLALLRGGDLRGELGHLLGTGLDDVRCVLLLSSLFWKNAFKYRGYSYRLCAQEAGMVAGNALLVAGALGLRGAVHYQFPDRRAGALLGLREGEEQLFAALPLRSASADEPGPVPPPPPPPVPAPVAHDYVRPEGPVHPHDALFTSIAENSLLADGEERPRELPDARPRCPHDAAAVVPMPPARRDPIELGAALRARTSGNVLFNPVARPLARDDFWEILRHATSPYRCDLRDGPAEPGVALHVVVFDVDGMTPGAYRFCREHGGLHLVVEGALAMRLQGALPVPNINLCATNAVVYLAADHAAASNTFGNRAYRLINLEAGLVAQRLCALSAAHGLAARVHNGYDAAGVGAVLGFDDAKLTPFFQIAVAHNRPGVQHGLPVLF